MQLTLSSEQAELISEILQDLPNGTGRIARYRAFSVREALNHPPRAILRVRSFAPHGTRGLAGYTHFIPVEIASSIA
jgi:hypothetical protein